MFSIHPQLLEPRAAAQAIIGTLEDPRSPHTVADVTAASGLALHDAERGLTYLTHEYRGHLRVTEGGDLLYLFPTAFTQPWKTPDALRRVASAVGKAAAGVARFIVRAWLMIVLVAYVVVFLALLIGMMFAGRSDRDDRRGGGFAGIGLLLRVLGDALFWTFHPFSPFAYGGYGYGSAFDRESNDGFGGIPPQRRRRQQDEVPFYERVNRFVFGPTPPREDPRARERAILAELRAQKGRIGIGDVMRVTGLPRRDADQLMAKLMLNYEGDVRVSEEGGIVYHFEGLRRTAESGGATPPRPRPAWESLPTAPPLTGNPQGSNLLIAALNGFNLVMSVVALSSNVTLAKIPYLLLAHIPLDRLPYDGVPVVLGVVPIVFSIMLFVLPLGRTLLAPLRERKVARERGRLGVLREVLTRVGRKAEVTDAALEKAWAKAAGGPPQPGEISARLTELGADVAVEGTSGAVRYRFADLETEAEALEAEREGASDEEKKLGRVVFASDD